MTYGDRDRDGDDHTVIERRDPLLGSVLDERFRIDFRIASGGFGAIYRATDLSSDHEVALKVLHPQLATDPMVVERFRREAATLHGLRDPHTITAYEIGEAPDGTLYIVMELLGGESLYDRFRAGGALPWQRVVHIARGVCSSLAEAHALGIVHRDLKPANIHLENRDGDPEFVKVLDFGIAKVVEARTDLTIAGQMIGTVDYMSPEQMVGGAIGPASDIYTLGVVMYEMISGKTPFADAKSATGVLAALLSRTPEPLIAKVPIPPALDAIVLRCLEREPQNRFAEIIELLDALDAVERVHYSDLGPTSPMPIVMPDEEATRIDVRANGGQPVLDARGPRGTPAPEFAHRPVFSPAQPFVPQPHALPYQSFYTPPPLVDPARGSQTVLPVVEPPPPPRASQPVIDLAAWHQQQQAIVAPERSSGYRLEYDMANVRRREAMVRRIMWAAVLAVLAIAALVVAAHL